VKHNDRLNEVTKRYFKTKMRKDTVFRLKDILSQQFMFWKQNMEYEKE
jgi:hypothetical protein